MSAKDPSNVSPDFINELLYANFQSMQVGLSLSRLKSGAKFCFSFLFNPYEVHVFIFSFSDEIICFCFFRSLGIQYSDHFYRYFSYLSYLIGYQIAELDVSSNGKLCFKL